MDALLQDVRHALRALLRAPAFALAALLSLGLGIGANTAIYTVYRSALLEPLAVAEPEQLVRLRTQRDDNFNENFSYPHFAALRASGAFADVFAQTTAALAVRFGNTTEQLQGVAVTPNSFTLLGVRPQMGRTFGVEQEQSGAAQVVILSDALWRRWFDARKPLGETIQLNGHPFTIIGVAPPSFSGMTRGMREEFWFPLASYSLVTGTAFMTNKGGSWLYVVGRMQPQATIATTEARLQLVDERLRETQLLGPTHRNTVVPAARGFDWTTAELRQPLRYLMAAVGLVLLIACANVANLLLARSAARRKDLAVRLAIGSSRGRLVRQRITESLTLALTAGGVGLLLASWLTDVLVAYRPASGVLLALDTRPDTAVLGFTFAVSLLTGILFGLGPALQTVPRDLMPILRDSAERVGSRLATRGSLVVAQVALTLALLVGATMMMRSMSALQRVDLGFTNRNALLASFDLDAGGYSPERGRLLIDQLLQRVRALPGVIAASAASTITPSPGGSRWDGIPIEGRPAPNNETAFDLNIVADDYFETLGVNVVGGRAFSPTDKAGTSQVAIVNEEMARRYWPGADPIGQRLIVDAERGITFQIIGIARDGKYRGLRETPETNLWRPLSQQYRPVLNLIVRTRQDPLALAPAIRAELRAIDPAIPLFDVRTLEQHVALATSRENMATQLAAAFSLLALLLAAIGLYGLLAFAVAQRTREIGLRIALGADRGIVIREVMGRGLGLVGVGIALGVPAALGATRLLGSMLYGVDTTDRTSFMVGALVLLATGALATLLPVRRALRVDPMIALRAE